MASPSGGLSAWMASITAATGVNSAWLNKALQAGAITPDMPPEAIYKAVSDMAAGGRPIRQMQLPLGGDAAGDGVRSLIRAPEPTGMIPFDNGARGFQLGANTTTTPATVPSPGTAMIPSAPRGLTGPEPKRIGTTAGVPVDSNPGDDVNMFGMSSSSLDEPLEYDDLARQWERGRPMDFDANGRLTATPRPGLPAPAQQALPAPTAMRDQTAVNSIANQFDNTLSRGGQASRTAAMPSPASPGKGGYPAWAGPAAAAGLIGAGAAAWNMMPAGMRSKGPEATGELTSTGGTADLAAESRPVPSVPTSTSPRDQAQAMIAKLNKMRRDAGGEVPEAKQMMAEINRLMAISNTQRNAMTPKQAQGSDDPHIQAQALIAQLNELRSKAGGEVPQAQKIMAEVRRLQALGDQRRNAAQTR